MPFTPNALNSMLTWGFSTATPTYARPTAWAASLHTASPGSSGASELPSAAGYARQSLGALTIASMVASNTSLVTFGPAVGTISGITWAGLWDSATYGAGNFWASMQLTQFGTTYTLAAAGIVAGGSGYVSGDVGKDVTVGSTSATVVITSVAAGAVTGVMVAAPGSVAPGSVPTNPVTTSGGGTTGSGLTLDCFWQQATTSYTLNNGDTQTFAAGQLQFSMAAQPDLAPA